jgi:hypothetical protein
MPERAAALVKSMERYQNPWKVSQDCVALLISRDGKEDDAWAQAAMSSTDLAAKLRGVPSKLRHLPGRLEHFLRAVAADPIEVARYVPERISERFAYPVGYIIEEQWEARLHRMLDAPWPCPERHAVDELWSDIGAELAHHELKFGRYTYGGYSDGDPALARAAWCTVRHMVPDVVVETGVARGVTSRVVLDALERNGRGPLWSVDLPHPFEPGIRDLIGAAVPQGSRKRWDYVEGSSRRRLPGLLAELGEVDVFIHDSLHTARNMRFEMDSVWKVLSPGGVMIIDDVHNQSFREFVNDSPVPVSMVCRSGDGMAEATCPSDLCWAFGLAMKQVVER